MKLIKLLPGTTYHIYSHANGNENLFRTNKDYNSFLIKYIRHIHPIVETYAYCLLPNHFHFVVKIKTLEEIIEYAKLRKKDAVAIAENPEKFISQQFSNLFNAHSKAINIRYNRKGSLFRPRFQRADVTHEEYFIRLIAYVNNNPVKHGICKNLLDWPYSSIHIYISNKDSRLNKKYLSTMLGNKHHLLKFHSDLVIDSIFYQNEY